MKRLVSVILFLLLSNSYGMGKLHVLENCSPIKLIGLNVITGTSIGDHLSFLNYSFKDTNNGEIQKLREEGFDFELRYTSDLRFKAEVYCLESASWVVIYDQKYDELKAVTFPYLFDLGLKEPVIDGKKLSCPFIDGDSSYDDGPNPDSNKCLEYLKDVFTKIENARLNKEKLHF